MDLLERFQHLCSFRKSNMFTRVTHFIKPCLVSHVRSFSALNDAVLTRDFIRDALYNKDVGYNRNKKIGVLEEAIDFGSLWGKWEFNKTIRSLYDKQGVNYMNAVELFTPFFSEAIAKHILRVHKLGTPLTVMETCTGSLTNTRNILSYYKSKFPNVYKNMHYYLLSDEFLYFKSPSIPEEYADKVSVCSIADEEKCQFLSDSAFLIMNDVMSGLPHDKIRVHYGNKGDSFNQYEQCIVVNNGSSFEELFLPVSDPLIKQYVEFLLANQYSMMTLAEHQNASIDAYNKNSALGNNRASRFKQFIPSEAFIPTVLMSLLQRVAMLTANLHVIAFDFDYLPPCAEGDLNSPINCINGPIVCSYDEKGRSIDGKSYLDNKYKQDIFFSTDFITLADLVKTVTKNEGNIVKLNNFVSDHLSVHRTRTMLGWNPLTKDFKNFSFMLSLIVCYGVML